MIGPNRPRYWKMILTIAPILGASLIAASLTVDEFHNWVSRACFTVALAALENEGETRARRANEHCKLTIDFSTTASAAP
jgi:hypothetical protein